jgi:Protein of unknown function (DUF3592)
VFSSVCILGVILFFFGLNLFLKARGARKRDQNRGSWPTAKGTILSIDVVPQEPLSTAGKSKPPLFDINMSYQFRAGGQLHFGSFFTYPRHLFYQKEVDRIQEQYKKGMSVGVHYNLENPQESYLEYERLEKYYTLSILMMALGGIIFIQNILTQGF